MIDAHIVLLSVWLLVGVAACIAGVTALLAAWFGRAGGMLIGGVVLGVGFALTIAMLLLIGRYWWIGVPPIALGIQTLRTWHGHPSNRRWTMRLDTLALAVVTISLLLAGITSLQRQRARDQTLASQFEGIGGYAQSSFDGTIRVALLRNMSAAVMEQATPIIAQMQTLEELGLEGTPVSNEALAIFSQLPKIQNLSLQRTPLDEGVGAVLARFKNLRYLDLINTNVDDAELPPLAALTKLKRLYLNGANTTPASVSQLKRRLPGAEISP